MTKKIGGEDIGIIGLGVMGLNLALNISDKGFTVIAYDLILTEDYGADSITRYSDIETFVQKLKKPRKVLIMVPAGDPVDDVIKKLTQLLDSGDLVIDGGNSHYEDTNARAQILKTKNINYLGVGISGGASGARNGPAIMAGGAKEVYQTIEPILKSIAARDKKGNACVARLGNSECVGHFVKMVHNSIEYAEMQMISEAYSILLSLRGFSNDQIAKIFGEWNKTEAESFLIDVTSKILRFKDAQTAKPLVDLILDQAGQKGTGKWGASTAIELGVPAPSLLEAVSARMISTLKEERISASEKYPVTASVNNKISNTTIRDALFAAKICAFAQGFQLLYTANKKYVWDINLSNVAETWKAGCIIRGRILENISEAFQTENELPNLILSKVFSRKLKRLIPALREVVSVGALNALPLATYNASLAYFDSYTKQKLPINLIQAQRDFFGAHGYSRTDKAGLFHTDWEKNS
tara:strand:- start:1284 stop:2687 length:1404 start_codon:yes stop_codon:yes gene_type:complete